MGAPLTRSRLTSGALTVSNLLRARWRAATTALILTTSLLWAVSASATVAHYMDLPALITRADVIVQGVVTAQETVYDKGRERSLLRTTITVERALWGEPQEKLVVQQFGGTHEGITTHISGDARFERGERVVLFLKRGQGQVHYLTSMAQSKYRITGEGDKATAQRELDGLAFVPVQGLQHKLREGGSEPSKAVASFMPELEALIAAIKGGSK